MLTSPRALGLILLATATGACLTPNPSFDDSATSTGTSTTSTTTATSTDPTSTTSIADTSTTGEQATSTTGLVEPTTDPSSSGTTVDSTSTGTTGTTADDSTTTTATTGDECMGIPGDLCEPVEISGTTYLLCELGTAWSKAVAICEAHCMRLIILDQVESNLLQDVLTERMTEADNAEAPTIISEQQLSAARASWWIGGYKDPDWRWLDGALMPPLGQGGWAADNPDINGTDACAVIAVYGKGRENGQWFDRSCVDIAYRFVCEPL